MATIPLKRSSAAIVAALTLVLVVAATSAQQGPGGAATLPDRPQVFNNPEQGFRVVPLKGLNRPWALAFLPDGNILITEMGGRLRIVRRGVLDPEPISGIPDVLTGGYHKGLHDIALHPRFAENKLVYFTYSKPMPGEKDASTCTVARGRFDGGTALTDVRVIFVANAWAQGSSAERIAFGPDGKIYLTCGIPTRHRIGKAESAQDPSNHAGKVLRINDDGTAPLDNPFVRRAGYRPEIYALGIRNALALVFQVRAEIWRRKIHVPAN